MGGMVGAAGQPPSVPGAHPGAPPGRRSRGRSGPLRLIQEAANEGALPPARWARTRSVLARGAGSPRPDGGRCGLPPSSWGPRWPGRALADTAREGPRSTRGLSLSCAGGIGIGRGSGYGIGRGGGIGIGHAGGISIGRAGGVSIGWGGQPWRHVLGNFQVDGNRRVDVLRAPRSSCMEWTWPRPRQCVRKLVHRPVRWGAQDSPATFAAMRAWKISGRRIPLNEDCWLGINGVEIGGTAYQRPVLKLVRDLEAAGFYVVVHSTWSAPGTQWRSPRTRPRTRTIHLPSGRAWLRRSRVTLMSCSISSTNPRFTGLPKERTDGPVSGRVARSPNTSPEARPTPSPATGRRRASTSSPR